MRPGLEGRVAVAESRKAWFLALRAPKMRPKPKDENFPAFVLRWQKQELTQGLIIFYTGVLKGRNLVQEFIYNYEKNISAQQEETDAEVRFSGADEDTGRTPCPYEKKTEGQKKTYCLR
jgi:hypothetical protein